MAPRVVDGLSARGILASIVGPAILVGIAIAQLWPGLSAGLSPPIAWDHGAHMGKAALIAEELLPWLRGWSDRVEAGLPQNTLYTPTGPLWLLLFRAITPHLEWHQTYAIAFTAFRAMVGLSVFRLARVAGAGRVGALAAGVLALADWGDHSEGGWFYDVLYGVWPMSLAMCVFFLGLADLLGWLDSGRRAQGARAALLLGIALFSHQASLLALAVIVPAIVLTRGAERTTLEPDVRRLLAVLLPAGLIACWWMLPMLAQSEWIDDQGQLYRSTADQGARMVAGEGLLNGGVWTGPLVALGLATALVARGHRRALAVGALIAMLVSAPGWLIQLDMVRWLPALGRIMYPRFLMIAKPMCFALAGCVIGDLVARAAPPLRTMLATSRGRLGAIGTLALLGAFAPEVPARIHTLVIDRQVETTATLRDWDDRRAMWAWLREQPASPFFRVLYVDSTTHLPQASPAFSGHPGIIVGLLVGESFRNTPDTIEPDALRAINVRYVVTAGSPPGALRGATREVQRFGSQRVYELEGWTGAVAFDPSGEARPRVAALERERVVIEPNGARVVVVRRALFSGWRAYAGGEELRISPDPVPGSARLRLIRIEVPEGASRVELRYVGAPGITGIALLLAVLGLALVGLLAAGPRLAAHPRLAARRAALARGLIGLRDRLPAGLVRRWHWVVLALPVIGLLLAMARSASGHHFAYDLASAEVSIRHRDGTVERCTGTPPEGPGWQCGSAPHVSVRRTSMPVDGRFRSCLTAHPPPDGVLVIAWPHAPLGASLRVGAGISDEAYAGGRGAPLDVRVSLGGEEQATLVVPNGRAWVEHELRTAPGTRELRLEIDAPDPARRWLCVDAIAR